MAITQIPPEKTAAIPPFEQEVKAQLATARRRLLTLDLAFWGLALGGVVLAYGLIAAFFDRVWDLPTSLRLVSWTLFLVTFGGLGAIAVSRLIFQRVNPRFLARQLECTLPQAKNSIVNWLDLCDKPLAPVIRGALGRRAAKDIGHADPETALSAKGHWWLASLVAILLLVLVGWLLAAPAQMGSLLSRAFLPFESPPIALRTTLKLLSPEGGDTAVRPNQNVAIRLQVNGYVPSLNQSDSLKLHFRYHQDEPFEERALQQDVDGTWTTTVWADQVRTGFWYKLTGGDARLPLDREFRVDVRAVPQALSYHATFKYRPYLQLKDRSVTFDRNAVPHIKDLRGTEVVLTVQTNRHLKKSALELNAGGVKKMLDGESVPDNPEACRFSCVLDKSGEFRLLFISMNDEENTDRQPGKIEVLADEHPRVVLTKPAKDLTLPANGTLYVEGHAGDDYGVKGMQLRLKLLKAPTLVGLQPKPYRPGISFELPNGKYPLQLDYSDFVALENVQTADGKPYPVTAGMELEYWLEARDNCDYPDAAGNLGQSVRFKLTIGPPEINKEKAAESRQQAQKQSQQNQAKQDSSLDSQKMQAQAEQDAGSGSGNNQGEKSKPESELDQKANQVQKAIDQANKPGTAKSDEETKSESQKDSPQSGSEGTGKEQKSKSNQKSGGGNDQPTGNKDSNDKKGSGDDKGKDSQNKPGDAKDAGKPGEDKQGAGTTKAGDPKSGAPDPAKSDAKAAPKDPGAQAKAGAGDQSELSKEKGLGDKAGEKSTKSPPGEIKNAKPSDEVAPKDSPLTTQQIADAKGGDPTNQPPPPDAKVGPPESSQVAGNAKAADRKDATMEDVAKLREQLGEAGWQELIKKELEKIGEQAGNDDVRRAAEKTLNDLQKQHGFSKEGGKMPDQNPPTKADTKAGGKDASDSGQGFTKDGPKEKVDGEKKDGSGPGKADAAAKAEARVGNPSEAGGGMTRPENTTGPTPVDEAAARRSGELQLESLKQQIEKLRDKLTPQVMKNLNWTEKEREDFLQKMLADALLRQQLQKLNPSKLPPPGSIQSLLPVTGPRNVQQQPGNQGLAIIENPEAPPEVRDALRFFLGTSGGLQKTGK